MAASLARAHTTRLLSHTLRAPAPTHVFTRRAMMSAWSGRDSSSPSPSSSAPHHEPPLHDSPPAVVPSTKTPLSSDASSPQTAARPPPLPKAERPKPQLRAKKAALTLTPGAVERLRILLHSPTPQLIRIGVRNKGCAGLSYHLEYVDKPGKFDEVVEQDGVKVVIDSKALFSIIGSEMDWHEDALSSKFAFKNPNITDACGCGESFTVNS
ncbi:hypothetical protein EWM64_g6949 [Hericium alpestre]|uniref:Iron-sulfur assembly protein 1 n=1 Tax=Hericium alpestre TaxID=135208 RepID=A0A4Y9ZSP3_9AGAM|nr:hypothetical protein EWM64_g6949 [Hericium alpestre]